MSAQGATLRRGIAHLPIWPVAVLVIAAAAVMFITTLFDEVRPAPVAVVTDAERLANSSAAIRERGAVPSTEAAVNPGMWTVSQAEAYLQSLAIREASSAAVREQGAAVTGAVSSVPSQTFAGLENPGAYVTGAPTYASGLENPGAYQPNAIDGKAEPHDPIVVGGEPCNQCR